MTCRLLYYEYQIAWTDNVVDANVSCLMLQTIMHEEIQIGAYEDGDNDTDGEISANTMSRRRPYWTHGLYCSATRIKIKLGHGLLAGYSIPKENDDHLKK